MLYISRFVYKDHVGVVDSDDDKEEIVNNSSLYHLCCDLGLDIEGVELFTDNMKFLYVGRVHVCQPLSTISVKQSKAKTLFHTDIKLTLIHI